MWRIFALFFFFYIFCFFHFIFFSRKILYERSATCATWSEKLNG